MNYGDVGSCIRVVERYVLYFVITAQSLILRGEDKSNERGGSNIVL